MPRPSVLVLRAPLTGRIVPLAEVPDPVFSSGIAGGGVAFAPAGTSVVAPCDGRVVHVHADGHELALVTPEGLEVMLHVGLATGLEQGRACRPCAGAGSEVRLGDTLLELDAQDIDALGSTVLTTLLVGPSSRVLSVVSATGTVTAGKDVVLRVEIARAREVVAPRDGSAATSGAHATTVDVESAAIAVTDPAGLHARAAARVADAARRGGATVWVEHRGTRAEATSVIGLLALDVAAGDEVRVVAGGRNAEPAIEAVTRALRASQSGISEPPANRAQDVAATSSPAGPGVQQQFAGTCASPGTVVGPAFQVTRRTTAQAGADQPRASRERTRLLRAVGRARATLARLRGRAQQAAGAAAADVIGVHEALLGDSVLLAAASTNVALGLGAAQAWAAAVETQAARLDGLHNPALASKADDLRDVGRRVLGELGATDGQVQRVPRGAIALAEDLDVSGVLGLANAGIAGIVTVAHGATSHVAVVAQGFGLPMAVGVDRRVLEIEDGTPVILDADAGAVYAAPTEEATARAEERHRRDAAVRAGWLAEARTPAVTTDGRRVLVTGNVATGEDIPPLLDAGGEGVGLLRSEFLFLDRTEAPSEDEQAAIYGGMAAALGPGRHLVVRTFDAGGDKPLAFLPSADRDDGPRRGLALTLASPDVLRVQLRAALRAASRGNVRVLFPLVTSIEDWQSACALLEEERRRLRVAPIAAGVSIEVPTVVPLLDSFARDAAFFAIGTNDLVDVTRGRAPGTGTAGAGALDPAVLDVIAAVTATARAHGRAVSVCGLAAADPLVVPLLVGLDVDELSVAVPAVPEVKARVRRLDRAACARLARAALAAGGPDEVRALLEGSP